MLRFARVLFLGRPVPTRVSSFPTPCVFTWRRGLPRYVFIKGGQNVNTVSTKAELRFHVGSADWLDAHTKERLTLVCRNQMNREGELVMTSQRHRTQESNLEDAFAKLAAAVKEAAVIPKVRTMRTGLSELSKAGYREDKRHRGGVKARRRTPSSGDDD